MKIVILTSSRKGTASYCLERILQDTNVQVVQVIHSENHINDRWKFYRRKFRKAMKIGVFGVLNGIRMRSWYNQHDSFGIVNEDIERTCITHSIPFKSVSQINSSEVAELIRSTLADLGLSLGNSYISPKIFTIPRYGMLNIHGEVLPQFQNAQSVIWQLYEGNSETGFTIHKIDKKIDTGEIILQEKFPILFRKTLKETVAVTSVEILKRAAEGLVRVLNSFDQYYKLARPQGRGKSYTTPSFSEYLKMKSNFRKLRNNTKKDG